MKSGSFKLRNRILPKKEEIAPMRFAVSVLETGSGRRCGLTGSGRDRDFVGTALLCEIQHGALLHLSHHCFDCFPSMTPWSQISNACAVRAPDRKYFRRCISGEAHKHEDQKDSHTRVSCVGTRLEYKSSLLAR